MNLIPIRRWIHLSAEERADVIEHLRAESDGLAAEGEAAASVRYAAAASVLADILYLPELVETTS